MTTENESVKILSGSSGKKKSPFEGETLSPRNLYILVGIIIFILSITLFRQTVANSITLQKSNFEKQTKLTKLTEKESYLRQLDANDLEKTAREVEQVFPSKKPVLELINSLKMIAAKNTVSISDLTLSPGKIENDQDKKKEIQRGNTSLSQNLQFLDLDFVVDGEFDKVNGYIKDMELTAPLVKIDNLGISPHSGEDGKKFIRLGLKVQVFFQAAPDKLPPVEQAVAPLSKQDIELLKQLSAFNYYQMGSVPAGTTGKDDPFTKLP